MSVTIFQCYMPAPGTGDMQTVASEQQDREHDEKRKNAYCNYGTGSKKLSQGQTC